MKTLTCKSWLLPDKPLSKRRVLFSILGSIILQFQLNGQQGSLPCNTYSPWIPATFTVVESHSSPLLACWEGDLLCGGSNVPANVVNSSTTDFATGHITGIGSLTLSVKDNTNNYTGGNFVGYVISSGLLSAGLFSSITVKTYLEDVQQESYSAVDLIGLSSAFLSGPIQIGFVTTTGYDEIEITFDNLLGIGDYNVYYAVNEAFCQGDTLICNEETALNHPAYPVTIDYSLTGSSGVSVAVVDNPEGAISASTTDFASLIHVASVLGSSFLTVEEQVTDYPSGTFVGFDIENLTLLGVGVLNYITVTSYLNDVQQQSVTGTALLAGVPVLSSSGRHTVGFVTTTSVDKVKITVSQPVGVTLGTTKVYSAIFEKLCAGPPPDCNVLNVLTHPDYPVLIDITQTGLTGAACAACNVIEPGNVIDDDPASYGQIIITGGVLTVGSIAAKDQLTDYPANTFAGFRIENASLVGVDALTGITISTYLNGSFQESQTNAGTLVSVGTDLLVNDDQEVVGFVTTLPFDEVKISLNNVGAFNIGTTRVHELVIQPFCPAPILCDTTYYLNGPEFPVYIDAFRTGVDGIACVACAVTGEQNVITADTNDYGLITVVANVAGSASIAVADALYTYPPGTFAGFVIQDMGLLLEADLFSSLTISTYNNGVLQESKSGNDLIDLAAIILFISDEPGRYNVGFQATLPFDEIRITVGSLVTAINLVRVYGAFVDTRASNGGNLFCNDGPVALPDLVTTDEDTPVIIDVLANDSDSDNPLGIPSVTTTPTHGTVTVNPDSTITYTPDPDYIGPDHFIYTICDPTPLCDTALVTVLVQPQIDTVIYTIPEDSTRQVCADDLTTFDVPATSISLCDTPSHGSATISGTCVTYDPDPNFNGSDTFCVYVCHPDFPTLCDTTIIIINVTPVNDPPLANPDVATTPEDNPIIIPVLANDTDPDNPVGPPVVTDTPDHGTTTVNGDGTITYTPDPDYVGPDHFIYTICDPQPLCDTALVSVSVSPQLDTLIYTIPEDSTQQVCIDDLPTVFSNPPSGISLCDTPADGSVIIAGDCVTYDPDPGFSGQDMFCVYVCHPDFPTICDTTIIIINVTPENDPPLANPDVATTPEDNPVIIPVLANDSDPDNPLGTPSVTTPAAHGTTTVNGDGTITYTPAPNYFGPDQFIYTLCDPTPLCDTALVKITVTPVNDPPLANPDVATTPEDNPIIIPVLTNDTDPDNPVGPPVVTDTPDHGTTTVNGDGTITYTPDPDYVGPDHFIYTICDPQPLCDTALVSVSVSPQLDTLIYTIPEDSTQQVCIDDLPTVFSNPPSGISLCDTPADGSVIIAGDCVTYDPDPGFSGQDMFCVYVCHPDFPTICDTTIIIINVTPENDPPVANPDVATTPEDNPVIIPVLANDNDPDNPLGTPAVTTSPAHGTTTVNGDGTITYTPAPNYFGPDQFIYTLCDPTPLCDTALVKITVSPLNDPPLANPDVATTPEDNPVIIPVLTNDSDPDNPLGTPSVTTPAAHGTTTVNGDGTITYTPAPNYFGPDQFIYTLCDPTPLCDTALVKITVSPVNDPPLANPDVATTPEDNPVIIPVLTNDSDPDNPPGTPTVTTPAAHGTTTVNGDGTITYTPAPNYFGPDQFIYTLCDPQPLCDTALVKITVTPVNDPPLANPDVATTPEDNPVIIPVLTNDSDPDNPPGTPTVTTPAAHGTTTVNGDGTITYTPAPNYFGPDQFIYTLCDPQPLCDTALVKITVTPVNDAPLANPDVATTPEDNPVIIPVLTNDSDPDNPLGTPTVTTPAAHGMTTVNGDGTITYTPDPNYFGPDQFIYTLCDPQPLCDTALVKITVTPVNDPPLANPDVATTPENMPVNIPVLTNDNDPDNPLGTPSVTTPAAHGTTTVNGDGTITYTPAPNYFGPDQFIYTLCDPTPLCDTALVKVNVTQVFTITITCPPNLVLQCGSNYATQINTWLGTATAANGCSAITITTDYDGSSIPDLSCDLSSGLTVTFTATDQCGNSATCTSTIYLDDSLNPVVTPGTIADCYNTMDEAIAAAIAATTASDNCATLDELAFDADVAAGPFCDSIITLTVTDACGNFATATYQTMINCQTVRLNVWMEGAYSLTGDSMRTTMNAGHTLPGQNNASPFVFDAPPGQPYQGPPYNYTGNLGSNYGDDMGMTPYPPDVVDWVLVTVRHNGLMPSNNIWTCAGWVHKDGTVTFPDNCPGPAINIGDDYYFVVQHRNHLGIMSPSFVNINCNGAVLEWDFRNSDSYKPVFRVGQKQVETGVWAMYAANGEQLLSIASINSSDRTLWRIWQGFFGYSPGDYDLNAATNSVDETIWKINQNRTSGVVFY